jgi:hypothetical protein
MFPPPGAPAAGNALPAVRSIPQILQAGKAAGFELVHHSDEALGVEIEWQVGLFFNLSL